MTFGVFVRSATGRHRGSQAAVLAGMVLVAGLLAGCGDPEPTPVSTPQASTTQATSSSDPLPEPSASASSADPTPQVTQSRLLALDGDGLEVFTEGSESRERLTFTTPIADVEETLAGLLAAPTSREPSPDCSPDVMITSYPAGFRLIAEKGEFVGWFVDGRNGSTLATEQGVRIGSTLAEVKAAAADGATVTVTEGSLGWEFTADGLAGTLDGEAGAVTNLWAGNACIFR